MLVSDQRPLPCGGTTRFSQLFPDNRRSLRINTFRQKFRRLCLRSFSEIDARLMQAMKKAACAAWRWRAPQSSVRG
jgi:hypothetical protein